LKSITYTFVQGGAPDQVTAARSVLNDWNAGSIPYHTVPPTIHPSSIPSVPRAEADLGLENPASNMDISDGSKLTTAADVGAAQIVSKFSEPFDLAGLFSLTDKAVLDNDAGGDETGDVSTMEGIDADVGLDAAVEADPIPDEAAPEETYVQNIPLLRVLLLTSIFM
jgi:nuclear GTP-binding protein